MRKSNKNHLKVRETRHEFIISIAEPTALPNPANIHDTRIAITRMIGKLLSLFRDKQDITKQHQHCCGNALNVFIHLRNYRELIETFKMRPCPEKTTQYLNVTNGFLLSLAGVSSKYAN